jgi:predicted outer membrane repeat protein
LEDLNEVTLKGLGEWVHSENNSSKMVSTVVINCDEYVNFVRVINIHTFSMERLTIINMHSQYDVQVDNVSNIRISQSSFNQLFVYSCSTLTMYNMNVMSDDNSGFYVNECEFLNITSSYFIKSYIGCQYCSSVIISNSVFYDIQLAINTYSQQNTDSITLKNVECVMHKNYAVKAIYINCPESITVFFSNVTIRFTRMVFDGKCNIIFKDAPSIIANNHFPYNGGGMWVSRQSTITSDGNTTVSFINNTAEGLGGAIYIEPPALNSWSSISGYIIQCSLTLSLEL